MSRSGLPIGLVWASWLVILLLELATPTGVVLGILYVIPLVIGAAQRSSRQTWRFLIVCCTATLLNLFVPAPPALNVSQDLVNRLLVCLCLSITTLLLIRNQTLEQQRIALDVQLAQAQLRGDVIATLTHDLKTPILGTLAAIASLESNPVLAAIRTSQQRCLYFIDALLQVFRAEQAWRLEIRDEGQGFRSGELPGLFQRFSPVSSDRPGAGLGLYLCRLIAEAHGGSISADNCPGGGARVWRSSREKR
jgi:signal transduction histidine kinase